MSKKHNKTGRSKGEKRDFVMLERYLLRSVAWRSLDPVARAAYIEFGHRYNGSNNGAIALSMRDLAEALGVGKDTANKAVNNLLDRGFIARMKQGYFSLKSRHCSEYRLTAEKCDVTNSLPSKDFTRWVPKVQNTVRLQGPNGTATGTEGEKTTRIYPFRSLKTDREGQLGSPHGTITGTPLYSTKGGWSQ